MDRKYAVARMAFLEAGVLVRKLCPLDPGPVDFKDAYLAIVFYFMTGNYLSNDDFIQGGFGVFPY